MRRLRPFTAVSGMLLAGNICRMGVYTVLTMAATLGGVATIAAHQIALQVRAPHGPVSPPTCLYPAA